MKKRVKRRHAIVLLGFCLLTTFAIAFPAFVLAQDSGIRVTSTTDSTITIAWKALQGVTSYTVSYQGEHEDTQQLAGITNGTSFTIKGLRSATSYNFSVDPGNYRISGRTENRAHPKLNVASTQTPPQMPMRSTCPDLPPEVVVNGYAVNTQCQTVGEVVIAKTDLSERGFIDAVDVWSYVPAGVEVCFRNSGWLAFLDADYVPRMAMELQSHERDGMTCGTIDRAGTVVLLASAPPAANPATSASALPIFESVPLNDCQIKLVETLFLRATPGGEIIGLVWLNSEVPAFEINGYWYKVEFEGLTGYISRYYREVLWGNCG